MKKTIFYTLLGLLCLQPILSFAAAPNPQEKAMRELQQKLEQLQQTVGTAEAAQKQAAQQATTGDITNPLAPPTAGADDQGNVPAKGKDTNDQNVTAATNEQAFANMVNQLLPMKPDEIVNLRKAYNAAQQAAVTTPTPPPKPTSSSIIVNLAPQATPPVIRLQAGYISSLVFMDATGQPWPIASFSLGDPNAFNIQWDKKSNTLLVQANTYYKASNLAILLRDLTTPVMLSLLPGQEAVDYRVDLRIPGLGPNAVFVQNSITGGATNPVLVDVLNGIAPPNSKRLNVIGSNECIAWVADKKLYLRTNLDVISPAWRAIISSMDGTHAYELQPTPVVLALEHGKDKTITLKLEGWE